MRAVAFTSNSELELKKCGMSADMNNEDVAYHAKYLRDFSKTRNHKSAYIHVIGPHATPRSVLEKMRSREAPLPATSVGVGAFKLYDNLGCRHRSGLVLTPDTISVVSYKHDFYTVQYEGCVKTPAAYFEEQRKAQIVRASVSDYSRYLSEVYVERGFEARHRENGPKKIRPLSDVCLQRLKYREMRDRQEKVTLRDVSSKYQLRDLLSKSCGYSVPSEPLQLRVEEIVYALKKATFKLQSSDPFFCHVLACLDKLNRMSSQDKHNYFCEGLFASPKAEGKYRQKKDRYGQPFLVHNEHLLLPTFANVLGVYVSVATVAGIDHAFQIKKAVMDFGAEFHMRKKHDLSAVLYFRNAPVKLRMCDWVRDLLPMSSKGLLEFARKGVVTVGDNQTLKPDLSALLDFRPDISAVRDSYGRNLIQIAQAAGNAEAEKVFRVLGMV